MSIASLPKPQATGRYRIALVCLGNICRSPMADVVLAARVHEAGLVDAVEVVSAGTGDWHVGRPMDERAADLLTAQGYDATRHRAQQVPASWLDDFDLVLAMDAANLSDLRSIAPTTPEDRLRLFRDFDPSETGGEVPDPYYGGVDGFHDVLTMVERTAEVIVGDLSRVVSH
ncbi:MAG: low molecular weight phosphotyrosine protein phosphatase [Nocardioidaceae bacterium]|nr:low molecular weight phosphotyrosine protein phosphatase [Nocardioidaceae bacterium]